MRVAGSDHHPSKREKKKVIAFELLIVSTSLYQTHTYTHTPNKKKKKRDTESFFFISFLFFSVDIHTFAKERKHMTFCRYKYTSNGLFRL